MLIIDLLDATAASNPKDINRKPSPSVMPGTTMLGQDQRAFVVKTLDPEQVSRSKLHSTSMQGALFRMILLLFPVCKLPLNWQPPPIYF